MWHIIRQTWSFSIVPTGEGESYRLVEGEPRKETVKATCHTYTEGLRRLEALGVTTPSDQPSHKEDDRDWFMSPVKSGIYYTIAYKYDNSSIITSLKKEKNK